MATSGRRRAGAGRPAARLRFLGAAREVTGSRFLLETRGSRVLVECGLHQGGSRRGASNRPRWPVAPGRLDAVVLTHAHLDHSGLLPRIVRDGYDHAVHVTRGTADLCGVLLPDSAWIAEHDARRASRRRQRQGRGPVEPLYTGEDARAALKLMRRHPFDEDVAVTDDVSVRFVPAGHILGAASVEVTVRDGPHARRIVFSGDIGRRAAPFMRPPRPPEPGELVVMESTYGDRDHRSLPDTLDEFADVLARADRERANVIVPVFAVGRAQEILHCLAGLERAGRVRPRPVLLDSPMAIDVTELYRRHPECFAEGQRADDGEMIQPEHLRFCPTPEQSMAINEMRGVIVLAASGMCEGGRVLFHLKHQLWRAGTQLVFAGFQARGTLGRAIVDGARRVRVMGEEIAVKADVHTLGGFSAHADRAGLLAWLGPLAARRPQVVLVHGEEPAQRSLAQAIEAAHGLRPWIPARGDRVELGNPGGLPTWTRRGGRPAED